MKDSYLDSVLYQVAVQCLKPRVLRRDLLALQRVCASCSQNPPWRSKRKWRHAVSMAARKWSCCVKHVRSWCVRSVCVKVRTALLNTKVTCVWTFRKHSLSTWYVTCLHYPLCNEDVRVAPFIWVKSYMRRNCSFMSWLLRLFKCRCNQGMDE